MWLNNNEKIIYVENIYNRGLVEKGGYKGGIAGRNTSNAIITNCHSYCSDTSLNTGSELELKTNILKIKDYFIEDIQDDTGKWKYNAGYPILKWQVEDSNNGKITN